MVWTPGTNQLDSGRIDEADLEYPHGHISKLLRHSTSNSRDMFLRVHINIEEAASTSGPGGDGVDNNS